MPCPPPATIEAPEDSVGGAEAGSIRHPIALASGCPVRIALRPRQALHFTLPGLRGTRKLLRHD